MIRYPAGVTPHGEYHLLKGTHPTVAFTSHDGTVQFRLQGGLAAPHHDRSQPAAVVSELTGLIPSWQYVDQKGATQHGVTAVASLFDPGEITAKVQFTGPDAASVRRITRAWVAANEHMKTGEFSVFTPEQGRWWTDVRWFKTPPDKIVGAQRRRQPFTQTWRFDDAFWRSYDHVDSFSPSFKDVSEPFSFATSPGLGANWDLTYTGTGAGFIYANGSQAMWSDGAADTTRTVLAQRAGYESNSDYQVVTGTLGTHSLWAFPEGAYVYLLARVNDDASTRIQLRIGVSTVRLSYFMDDVETVLRERTLTTPSRAGDVWRLVAGKPEAGALGMPAQDARGNLHYFSVLRNGVPVIDVSSVGSMVGADYRGAGFGMKASAGVSDQNTPPPVTQWTAGDNTPSSQQTWLKRINAGDQPMWDSYTLYGPGYFAINDGDYRLYGPRGVLVGPIYPGQVVQVNTDPEVNPVVHLYGPSNGRHPWTWINSRFRNPVPPAPSDGRPTPNFIACTVSSVNANSMIVASGTPRRRFPL